MGCDNTKEKLENEIVKTKMKRVELQMERYKQLDLLKRNFGIDKEVPVIPDYIDKEFVANLLGAKDNLTQNDNKDANTKKKKRLRKSKSLGIKRKSKILIEDKLDENKNE